MQELTQITFQNGEVMLSAMATGPEDGAVVLLLHGFPEFWYGWRKQIGALAEAGFRVVAPDQRGYNNSSKPDRVQDYAMQRLVSDVVAIIQNLTAGTGDPRIFLVGHDWGALVAWCVAAWYPQMIRRLVILNVPHPAVMPMFLLTRPRQLLRSWYLFFFQIPDLPERLFAAGDYAMGVRSLRKSSLPGTFTEEDLVRYRKAWAKPSAVRSMIHWYRAILRKPFAFQTPRVRVPTLILWGKRDAFLLPSLATESLRYCDQGRLQWFDNATHWVQHERSEEVNGAILNFFCPGTPVE